MRTEEALKLGQLSSLDEPVYETLMRDLRQVGSKLQIVLLPLGQSRNFDVVQKLREWDLWGPLLVCLTLSTILSITAPGDSGSLVFAAVFVIVWIGAGAVTLNAQLLGGTISFLQSVCILGYCVFPLTLAAFVLFILHFILKNLVVKLIVVAIGFIWSTRASVVFMERVVKEERRLLAVFPVFLFYTFIAWLIILQ
jgi:hypothetical protein